MNTDIVDVNRLTLCEWDTALPASGIEEIGRAHV